MRAIRVHQFGGPEAMVLDQLHTREPAPGQALVRVLAAGVNFVGGSYATEALIPLNRLVALPAGLDERTAAAAHRLIVSRKAAGKILLIP